jgi:ABC-type dipeptide/oligopeptide/nickel transport system permease component
VVRRLLWVIPVVLGASIVAFTIMHVAPGSPWSREGRQLNPEVVEQLTEELGLDEPLPVQYLAWLSHMLQGDFGIGTSTTRYEVTEIVVPALGTTLILVTLAFALALAVGLPLGMVAALRHGTVVGWTATGVALLGMAAPAFALAAFLRLVTAEPTRVSIGLPSGPPEWATAVEWILPTVALAALPMAQIARHTKGAVLEVIHSEYVRTAHSKGLREEQIVRFHLLRNAAIPVVTVAGSVLALLVTGSIVVERVFDVPGLGNLYYWAIRGRDFTLLMAITFLYAVFVAVANAAVDIAYGFIDPRIREGSLIRPEDGVRG